MEFSINPSKFFIIKNSENIHISYKKIEDIYKGNKLSIIIANLIFF